MDAGKLLTVYSPGMPMEIRRVVPNRCLYCGADVPDGLKYRKVKTADAKAFRIAVCGNCGKDLRFSDMETKGDYIKEYK